MFVNLNIIKIIVSSNYLLHQTKHMSPLSSKIFAALLVAIFIGSGLSSAILVASVKPVASCHGQPHSKSMPQTGYQCCISGHSPALQSNVYDAHVPSIVRAKVVDSTVNDD